MKIDLRARFTCAWGGRPIGVGGMHLVLELPLSEDGCIWAGPPLVDPPIQVSLQNPR